MNTPTTPTTPTPDLESLRKAVQAFRPNPTAKPAPFTPTPAPTAAPTGNVMSPSNENSLYTLRGPHIAKVELLPPGETID